MPDYKELYEKTLKELEIAEDWLEGYKGALSDSEYEVERLMKIIEELNKSKL